ncbi:hypothetical protein ACMBCM_09865 [Spiroplasma sp. K1]
MGIEEIEIQNNNNNNNNNNENTTSYKVNSSYSTKESYITHIKSCNINMLE